MAITSYTAIESTIHKDQVLNATAEQVGSGAEVVFGILLNNSSNTVASFFKGWTSSPTVGTTPPHICIRVPALTTLFVTIDQLGTGMSFAGLWVAGVTTGGQGGSTAPTSPFIGTFFND